MILDRKGIEELLPHREPFLFVDNVEKLEEGKSIVASYTFPLDSFFFKGHFPEMPIVPGVILLEAMAQAAGVLGYKTDGSNWREKGAILLKLDRVVFRKTVHPGDKVVMEAVIEHIRGQMVKFKAKATVNGERCAEATLLARFTGPIKTME